MIKNKKLLYGLLIVCVLVAVGIGLFLLNRPPITPDQYLEEKAKLQQLTSQFFPEGIIQETIPVYNTKKEQVAWIGIVYDKDNNCLGEVNQVFGNAYHLMTGSKIGCSPTTKKIVESLISEKYPNSQIEEILFVVSEPGPNWQIKVKLADRSVKEETFSPYNYYALSQCEGVTDKDRCYIDVGGFYKKDVNICKKISDEYKRNNCYALVAGLTAPNKWSPSICEDLSDEEAKSGCIKFFETPGI